MAPQRKSSVCVIDAQSSLAGLDQVKESEPRAWTPTEPVRWVGGDDATSRRKKPPAGVPDHSDAQSLAAELQRASVVDMGFVPAPPTQPPQPQRRVRDLHGEAARRVRETSRLLGIVRRMQATFRGVILRRFHRRWIRKLRIRTLRKPPVKASETCPDELVGLLRVVNVSKPVDPRDPPILEPRMARVLPFASAPFEWSLYWHRRHDGNPAIQWLRRRITQAATHSPGE